MQPEIKIWKSAGKVVKEISKELGVVEEVKDDTDIEKAAEKVNEIMGNNEVIVASSGTSVSVSDNKSSEPTLKKTKGGARPGAGRKGKSLVTPEIIAKRVGGQLKTDIRRNVKFLQDVRDGIIKDVWVDGKTGVEYPVSCDIKTRLDAAKVLLNKQVANKNESVGGNNSGSQINILITPAGNNNAQAIQIKTD